MKRAFLSAAALALMIAACDFEEGARVRPDTRGTWERTEDDFWPENQAAKEKGRLVLSYDTIIISGPFRHLRGFTRGIALEARTEDGNLYIKDRGAWQSPIAFTRWHSAGNAREELLTLKGGVHADETLKLISE